MILSLVALLLGAAPTVAQTDARTVAVYTIDLVASPVADVLYASVPNNVGAYSNSVVAIDPVSATVVASLPVGLAPGPLAISDDGTTLYVGTRGDNLGTDRAVVEIDVASWAVRRRMILGAGPTGIRYLARDIVVKPGAANVIAVAVATGYTGLEKGIALFVDGVEVDRAEGARWTLLAFGDRGDRLYGFNNRTTAFTLTRFEVETDGLRFLGQTEDVIERFGVGEITARDGRVYFSEGTVADAETLAFLGRYPKPGRFPINANGVLFVVPAPEFRRTPALASGNGAYLVAYNADTLQEIAVQRLTGAAKVPLVRWGERGVAYRAQGLVHIVETGLLDADLVGLRPDRRTLAFGAVEGVVEQTITVSNPGSATLQVREATTDVPGLTVSPTSFEVVPGGEAEVRVRLVPAVTETLSGAVQFESNAFEGAISIPVTGSVTVPILEYRDATLDFGEVEATGAPRTVGVRIENPSQRAVEVTGVRIEPAGVFTVDPSPFTIPSRSGRSVFVAVPTDREGTYAAQLIVESDAFGSPDTLAVRARVVRRAYAVTDVPGVAAGPVRVGQTASVPVQVTNPGSATLDATVVSSVPGVAFSPATFALAPGDTLRGAVEITLPMIGEVAAVLAFAGNAEGTPEIVVRATGVPAGGPGTPGPFIDALGPPYPNPARTVARVTFSTTSDGPVRLSLHDTLGREVAVIVDERGVGIDRADLPLSGLPAGVYQLRLLSPGFATSRSITVVR